MAETVLNIDDTVKSMHGRINTLIPGIDAVIDRLNREWLAQLEDPDGNKSVRLASFACLAVIAITGLGAITFNLWHPHLTKL